MKKNKLNIKNAYSVLLFSSMTIGIVSCNSDDLAESQETAFNIQLAAKNLSFDARPLNMSEEKVYIYPDDSNYEMIDMGRFALGKAIKDLLDEDMIAQIMDNAKISYDKTVSFEELFSLYPALQNQLNDKLINQNLPGCPYDFSSYDKIQNIMSRNGIDYQLSLYVYNLGLSPGGGGFILSPGTEIEDENNYDDQIMAWYKDPQNSTISTIKINEDEAKTYSSIGTLLTINLRIKNPSVILGPNPGPTPAPVPKSVNIREINIHYRYEKNGKSEVYMHAVKNMGNAWNGVFGSNWPANDYSKHLTSTKKTNQWVTVDKGQYLFQSDVSAVWNTFERDWYQSFKFVNNVSMNGTPVDIFYKGAPMTFADEWYALIPSGNTLSNNLSMGPFKSSVVGNGSSNTYMQGEYNKFEARFYSQIFFPK